MWNQEDTRSDKAQPREAARTSGDAIDVRGANFGRSVSVKGEVSGSEDLMIDGQVDGRIDLPDHTLTVGPNATIMADITVRAATIFGTVVGSITAREKIDVRKAGSVDGQLTCERLVVQDGAILNGKIDAKGDRKAAKESPVKAA
jgi:cytoskeletal protein CcmA (bactofilin family)